MTYQHLFRQPEGSRSFGSQHAFQDHQPQLSIVDPDSADYTGWHEMEFTTAPLNSSVLELGSHQSLGQKYPPAAMDREQDSLAYLQSSNNRQEWGGDLINHSPSRQRTFGPRRAPGDIFSSTQYSFAQLFNMEASLPPMDQSSLTSSRANDDSNMTNSDLTTIFSASDSVNGSSPMNNLDPIAISRATRTDAHEKLCPLIAGQVDSCQPSRCGPDAPCMNFTTLPSIEECTSVPCITDSPPARASVNNDSMSVELHQRCRPSVSTRTSTTTTSRPSTRRSSSTTATTIDSQPDIAPLPSRRSATTTCRQTRASNKAISIPTAVSSDNDDEDGAPPPTSARTKPTAPSKADTKQRAKQAHSLVERKYRENLNAKITQLHSTLQDSHYGPRITGEDLEQSFLDGENVAAIPNSGGHAKVRKSDVLTEAMNYVNQTEVEMRHMENEIHRLGERERMLEKLVRCDGCSLLKQMVGLQVQNLVE